MKIYQEDLAFNEEILPITHKLLEIEEKGTIPNPTHFMRPVLLKPESCSSRKQNKTKLQTNLLSHKNVKM